MNLNSYRWMMSSFGIMMMLGFVVAGLVSTFVIVVPQLLSTVDSQSQIENHRQEINVLAKRLESLKKFNQEDLENRMQVILEVLPGQFDAALVVSTLKQIAQERNLSLKSVKATVSDTNENKSTSAPEDQALQLEIQGNVDEIVNFISAIGETVPLIEATSLETSPDLDKNSQDSQSKIEIVSFAMQLPERKNDTIDNNDGVEISGFTVEDEKFLELLKLRTRYAFVPASGSGEFKRPDPFEL